MSTLATLPSQPAVRHDPDLGAAPDCTVKSVEAAERAERWWAEQWSKFPTYHLDEEGTPHYWHVPEDSGVYQDDWPLGERLAEETVSHMRRFPEGSTVLRHILREIDQNSTIAQGFLNRLEDILISPALYRELGEPEQ